MKPRVTFVVPCYKLAHLLRDCVDSILAQTYRDFEVLIMDDCSPDTTPEVAATFSDPRVRHVRNEVNLGHLRNYNRGIELARGEYLWLISADDCLRRPYVLERFVAAMEQHRDAGFVFCPAMHVRDGQDIGVSCSLGDRDLAFGRGHFLEWPLLAGNSISAPAVMARKALYHEVGGFPLDMPYAGDWFIWCAFAVHAGVVYLAEPMVNYRLHDANITKQFEKASSHIVEEGVSVRWRTKDQAERAGQEKAVRACRAAIADDYAMRVTRRAGQGWDWGMTLEEFEASLQRHSRHSREQRVIRAVVYSAMGDHHWKIRDLAAARHEYGRALRQNPITLRTWAKFGLAHLGGLGTRLRGDITSWA